ncbi:Lon protease family protein [Pseudothauera rhizosphaerae]|uniref:endopeptidase La n=1 Tax=Pseudothauera rhizosphaerae TaxID=2565932 RepID=A0A4S4AFT1_9RHOO|nr:AAA family ATPase [Pseudothauera rhizosphaerae]THF58064.1 ATP-dependent protease [Pseudothauera rhizosphaerae]
MADGPARAADRSLDPARLRACCAPEKLPFATTAELADVPGGLGQERAEEALRFGLAMKHPGYHVFVLGGPGTGRHATTLRLLREVAAARDTPPDLCYLHDFDKPQCPRLLALPAGRGGALRAEVQTFIRELRPAIEAALDSETHSKRVEALQEAHENREESALRELGQACAADGLVLLRTPQGFVFAPSRNGQTLSPEEFDALPEDDRKACEALVDTWSDRLGDLLMQLPDWRKTLHEAIAQAERDALAPTVTHLMRGLREHFADLPAVGEFLDAICADLLDSGTVWRGAGEEGEEEEEDGSRFQRYQVNLLVDHSGTEGAPVVMEDNPAVGNLIGRIEHVVQMGMAVTNFTLVRAGALHRASGGYLVLDVERLLVHPFAWEGLKRVLRSGEIRIEPPTEAQGWSATLTLDPAPVPCDVKVVLVGEREMFYLLNEHDPDFPELFKVAADFDDDLPRTAENELHFAGLLAKLARQSALQPFDRVAVARLIEHGSRLAEDGGRLSLHTRQLADVMREADLLARNAGQPVVGRTHIDRAVAARARRFGRYAEQVRESMLDGTTLIATAGEQAGQINGLVVVELGGERFGHPMRITATVRLGEGDVVDIERETELGGAIHSKGVLILSAFLASRYARHQPLSLSASLVFEQSYTPVEGDSASLAELCALLSALADVPIRQSLAITGSINQFGGVQAIGGVNEKIEGFFDLCAARGLTGEQGVVIPTACIRHLMLRDDVVEAVAAGRFAVHAVATVDEAMEVLTGMPAGVADAKGIMPRDTLNHRVAGALADMTAARHAWSEGHERPRRRVRRQEH